MVLIGYFRAIVRLNGNAYITPELMAKPWSCIVTAVRMRKYRQLLSKLILEGEEGISAFKYFSQTLMEEAMTQSEAQESKPQGGPRNRKSNNKLQ